MKISDAENELMQYALAYANGQANRLVAQYGIENRRIFYSDKPFSFLINPNVDIPEEISEELRAIPANAMQIAVENLPFEDHGAGSLFTAMMVTGILEDVEFGWLEDAA